MGIFSLGINFGLMTGFLIGGWVSQWYGWRAAFYVVGLPGLLLALVVRLTLREPPRGYAEGLQGTIHEAPSFATVVRFMTSTPTLRHLATGAALASFVGYGVVLWLPTFLMRSHGLQSGQIGTALAFLFGVLGGIGTYTSGQLADRLSKHDVRWNTWIVSCAILTSLPFTVLAYLTADIYTATILSIVPALLGGFYLAPSFALNQSLVSVRMRSVASAILLFIINIIGLGLGPQTVGLLSDFFREQYGNESLRYALICLSVVNIWTALHYFLAGRTVQADLAKAAALRSSSAFG
jgi:predicted MFS family arabinose efflux permease